MTQESSHSTDHVKFYSITNTPATTPGIAANIARAFINTPVTPILLIGCLCLGLLGLFFIPRQEEPQISIPTIDIFVQYPGASAKQVASLVTENLERIMQEIPGVKHVYSATRRGAATITIQFHVGENMEKSIVKVYDKLQSNLDKIPPDVQMPQVKPISADDAPLITATLWSKTLNDSQLRALALQVLQELSSVPNAGMGFVVGGRREQVRVEVLIERLAGYGITLDRIASTVRGANSRTPAGGTETGGTVYNVYSGAFLRTANDIAKLVVGTSGTQPIYIADVAKVSHIPEDTRQIVMHYTGLAYTGEHHANGEQAVTVAIAKKAQANGVAVSAAILSKIQQLKTTLLPDTVQIEITRNYGASANAKVNALLQTMFETVIIVSALCLIGLGARAAFVVITVIPMVILLTLWLAMLMGYTIDRISIFALIFTIGILVDDATVVVENIFRHWLLTKKTSLDQAINAVDEVGNPTILATVIIICALLPLNWVSGLMGPYLHPISVLSATAMALSLLAAFIFIPWLALRMRPRNIDKLHIDAQRETRTQHFISAWYRPLILPLIHNRKLGLIFLFINIIAVVTSCALFFTHAVPIKILPFDNKAEFSVLVNMPEGTALPETANVMQQLAEKLRKLPEVTTIQSYTGTAQPFNFNGMMRHYYWREHTWEGDLLVSLTEKHQRIQNSHELAVQARHILTPLARQLGATIAVVEMPSGPPVLQTLVAEIYGPDAQTRRQLATDLTAFFTKTSNIVDINNDIATPYYYWQFQVDTEKAVRRGISTDTINQNLAMAMGGFQLGDVKRENVLEPTYIVLQVPLANRSDLTTLSALPIATSNSEIVPLGELGHFVLQLEDWPIHHLDLRSIEYVTGEMEGFLGTPIYGILQIEKLLQNYIAPDGVRISGIPAGLMKPPMNMSISGLAWSGEWTITYETFRDMSLAFIIALLLIYGLLVWQFTDILLATLIMAPIPLSLVGIIIGHWLMNIEFTATSMIGLIALSGIMVRQSILIVEFIKLEVIKGISVTEAAIIAAEIRMRPIVITSLTTAGGAWFLMFDPIFQGLAISTFFGVFIGTLLALFTIPLGCISLKRSFYLEKDATGERILSPRYTAIETVSNQITSTLNPMAIKTYSSAIPLWLHLWRSGINFIIKLITISGAMWRWIKVIADLLWNPPHLKPQIKTFIPPLENEKQVNAETTISTDVINVIEIIEPEPITEFVSTPQPIKDESNATSKKPIIKKKELTTNENDANTTSNIENELVNTVRRKAKSRKLRGIRLRDLDSN